MLSTSSDTTTRSLTQNTLSTLKYCKFFLFNPFHAIRSLPAWSWFTALSVYIAYTLICGALQGLIQGPHIIFTILLTPILSVTASLILSTFLYFTALYFFQKNISMLSLFICTTLSSAPNLFLQIFSGWIPPISLVGMAFFFTLLCVGLVENFQFPKTVVLKSAMILYVIYFTLWVINTIAFSTSLTSSF